jgi:Uma2 family endonuclease
MAIQSEPRLTPEQYLEIERTSDTRHEFYRGEMYAMSGGSLRHAVIIGNFSSALHGALTDRPCVVVTSDLRTCVAPDGLYTYPDIVVICGEPKFVDSRTDTVRNPVLLVEVLSPSTESHDRGFKSAQYRTLEGLQEYVLVSQTEARVETHRRQPGNQWLLIDSVGMDAVCELASVDCRVPLAEIYRKVEFENPAVSA